jgi:hypothetical protein
LSDIPVLKIAALAVSKNKYIKINNRIMNNKEFNIKNRCLYLLKPPLVDRIFVLVVNCENQDKVKEKIVKIMSAKSIWNTIR